MPTRKRVRLESSDDEAELPDNLIGLTTKRAGGLKCPQGDPLHLVNSHPRRGGDQGWSCDSCKKNKFEKEEQRYRCDQCDYDICGSCSSSEQEKTTRSGSLRRSSRDPKPSFQSDMWHTSPTSPAKKKSPPGKVEEKSPRSRPSREEEQAMSPRTRSRGDSSPRTTRSRGDSSPRSTRTRGDSSPRSTRTRGDSSPRTTRSRVDSSPRTTRGGGKSSSPKSKAAPESSSPAATRRSRRGVSEEAGDKKESKSPAVSPSPSAGRATRSNHNSASPKGGRDSKGRPAASPSPSTSRQSARNAGKSPRKSASDAASKIQAAEFDTDSMDEEAVAGEPDSPFYSPPQHVRFSPSAKTASPYSKKLRNKNEEEERVSRSGRSSRSRGYLQALPSEDEQSEFNKQYSRDLRKRQQRKNSNEETQQEPRRSGRVRSNSQSEGETPEVRGSRSRVVRQLASDSEGEVVEKRRSQRGKKVEQESEEDEDEEDKTVTEAAARRSSRLSRQRNVSECEDADTESAAEKGTEDEDADEEEEEEEEDETEDDEQRGGRRTSRRQKLPVDRLQYRKETETKRSNSNEIRNMDKYSSDDEFQGGSSPRKKKYSLREKPADTKRYQTEFPGNEKGNTKERGLIRRSSEARTEKSGSSRRRVPGRGGRSNGAGERRRVRTKTGDSSSPTSSGGSSDEEAFDKRKNKRMMLEREKLRPLNMNKKDVTKSIFKDRAKVGSSLADVQPMEMDMGVSFDSVGGLKDHVDSLKEMVMFPLLYPEVFTQFNVTPPRGVLFYGPPGTGKTLLARALACECSTENKKVAFFMRKGADCLSKWIGESERQLRLLFDQAYAMRPSIIFFDEIDGLAPVRSSRQDQIHSSIVSTLLALMDGLDNRGEIIVIGATNRIENIDPALRRPGRFDRELRFSLPSRATRKSILRLYTKNWVPEVSQPLLNTLANRTIGYCGADLKGLCAEAALNALRRRYPQVYTSNQKLGLDVTQIQVQRVDFDKAVRRIVPSTHRVEDKVLSPLPKHVRPLLEATYTTIVAEIKRVFPHSAAGKGAVIPTTLTHRPRLLLVGGEGQGQTTYIGPAVLHFMEKLPCQKLDIPALFSNSARTPEEACTQIFHSARRTMPGVLYIPHLCTLWETISDTVRATLITLLADIPTTAPLLLLAVADTGFHSLPLQLQAMFIPFYKEVYKIENPGEGERREFFRPLFTSATTPPRTKVVVAPPKEKLVVLPAPESRKLTEREEKRLKKKEEALLRELRIFLRDVWNKINRESKFFMFRFPIDTEEVYDYLDSVKQPMDFEKMHMKLDDGEYQCAQQFLDDIDLIAENAIEYNCDVAYETNRIICHRARALQDFSYALVKAEMDTDFEEECKEIVERREAASKKLKKIDKDLKQFEKKTPNSPSKIQDMLAITSAACEVCGSRDDEDSMLLCDGCDAGWHTFCCTPVIEEVPEGDWFCVKCAGVLGEEAVVSMEEEEGGGSGKKKKPKRRRSNWASGVVPKKKKAKRKEESDEEKEEAEEETAVEEDGDDPGKNDDDEEDDPVAGPSKVPGTPPDQTSLENSLAPTNLRAGAVEEEPSQPTGVRIDINKMNLLHSDLVRATDGYTVERLERCYTILAKIIRRYSGDYDRTNLPADLAAELQAIRQSDRVSEHTLHRR